jgi:hypothetical protein
MEQDTDEFIDSSSLRQTSSERQPTSSSIGGVVHQAAMVKQHGNHRCGIDQLAMSAFDLLAILHGLDDSTHTYDDHIVFIGKWTSIVVNQNVDV